jgi:nickel-type superoxide dismutase maturation protease
MVGCVRVRAVGHGQGTRYSDCGTNCPAPHRGPPPAVASSLVTVIRPRGGAVVALVIAGAAIAWSAQRAWRQFERVEVFGLSMAPALQPGDRVLVRRSSSLRQGDIVAAVDPRQPARTVLKRVADAGAGRVFLLGDNRAHSTDSRQWGPVPIASVQGKAVYRYAPPARAGRLSKPAPNGEGPNGE